MKNYKMNIWHRIAVYSCCLFLGSMLMILFPLNVKAEPDYGKEIIMVSMGDSFSSGEGIRPFYGPRSVEKQVKDADWLAHRSEKSWPGQLKLSGLDEIMKEYKVDLKNKEDSQGNIGKWYFVASSGALTENIFEKEQNKPYFRVIDRYVLSENDNPQPKQAEIFESINTDEVDYITLTLGGNDVGFTGVVESCAMNVGYSEPNGLPNQLIQAWNNFYEADDPISEKLSNVYEKLWEKMGKKGNIIVAGYPQLLDPAGGNILITKYGFDKRDAALVNKNVSLFNDAIEHIVLKTQKSKNMNIYFVSVEDAFMDHRAYADKPYINKIMVPSTTEDLEVDLKSAFSMHPNEEGATAYAACVQDTIDWIEAGKPDISVSGQVIDKNNQPVDNLTVVIKTEKAKKEVFRGTTNENGEFRGDVLLTTQNLRIEVSNKEGLLIDTSVKKPIKYGNNDLGKIKLNDYEGAKIVGIDAQKSQNEITIETLKEFVGKHQSEIPYDITTMVFGDRNCYVTVNDLRMYEHDGKVLFEFNNNAVIDAFWVSDTIQYDEIDNIIQDIREVTGVDEQELYEDELYWSDTSDKVEYYITFHEAPITIGVQQLSDQQGGDVAIAQDNDDEIIEQYKSFIQSQNNRMFYSIYDIDKDGYPELFFYESHAQEREAFCDIYFYRDGSFEHLERTYGPGFWHVLPTYASYPNGNGIVEYGAVKGKEFVDLHTLNEGTFSTETVYNSDVSKEGTKYYKDADDAYYDSFYDNPINHQYYQSEASSPYFEGSHLLGSSAMDDYTALFEAFEALEETEVTENNNDVVENNNDEQSPPEVAFSGVFLLNESETEDIQDSIDGEIYSIQFSSYEIDDYSVSIDLSVNSYTESFILNDDWIYFAYIDSVYVADIDSADSYGNFIVVLGGEDGEMVTYFFAFNGNEIQQIASFQGKIVSESISGNGTVLLTYNLGMPTTTYGSFTIRPEITVSGLSAEAGIIYCGKTIYSDGEKYFEEVGPTIDEDLVVYAEPECVTAVGTIAAGNYVDWDYVGYQEDAYDWILYVSGGDVEGYVRFRTFRSAS